MAREFFGDVFAGELQGEIVFFQCGFDVREGLFGFEGLGFDGGERVDIERDDSGGLDQVEGWSICDLLFEEHRRIHSIYR